MQITLPEDLLLINNNIGILKLKCWIKLLQHSRDNFFELQNFDDSFSMDYATLKNALHGHTINKQIIKKQLTELASTHLNGLFNSKLKDGQFIESLVLKENGFEYKLPKTVLKILINPNDSFHVTLKQEDICKLNTKYTLLIYLLTLFSQNRDLILPISDFKNYFGLSQCQYHEFKHLHKSCIKTPLTKLNQLISIEPTQFGVIRKNKKIIALRLSNVPQPVGIHGN